MSILISMMKSAKSLAMVFSLSMISFQLQAQELGQLVLDGLPVKANSLVSKAMVAISVPGAGCSGVAISQTHILTAAHCVENKPAPSSIRIYLGVERKAGPTIRSYEVHPGYGWEAGYVRGDLAILRTSSKLPKEVVPAPPTSVEPSKGLNMIAAGYGYADAQGKKSGKLLYGTFVFGSTAEFKPGRFSDGSRFLQYNGSRNLCSGDSGGATFRVNSTGLRTVGIHSMANCFSRGYDVHILDYSSWIQAAMKRLK